MIQTAGEKSLEEFTPQFAHFTDDVLLGQNWNNLPSGVQHWHGAAPDEWQLGLILIILGIMNYLLMIYYDKLLFKIKPDNMDLWLG